MRCCERQDESHVGLIKYLHSHTATHKVFPSPADVSLPTLAGSLILFLLFLFHGVIDTINERSQSLILPLCQMTPSAKLSKILQTNREKVLLLSCSLTSMLAVTVCKHTLTPSRLRSVLGVSKLVRVAIIHFYKGALHHTKKLKGDIWRWAPTVQEKLWVSLESLTNPHTWASEHIHHLWGAEQLFKLKATVKVTITLTLDLKQHRCAKPGCHAHWRLRQSEPTSPSLFKPLTSANTHYFKHICPKDHYSHVLIHTMLIFESTHYTISTEPLM